MSTQAVSSITLPESRARTGTAAPRLLFVDNLRLGLISLVVLHHVALTYGAAGLFYYVEFHPSGFSRSLLIFVLTNQAWFMGAFFLVAGYFTPASFDRKGPVLFLRDRLLRLGIPLVVYMLLLNPLTFFGSFFLPDVLAPLTWDTYRYSEYVRMGPMWFVALLLIFSFGYAGWRMLGGRSSPATRSTRPGYASVGAFVLGLAAVSFLLRMHIAIGESEWGFPSLAYLPQYVSFFVLGAVAFRRDWFRTITPAMGVAGLGAAAAAAVFLFPLAFSGRMFSLELSESIARAMGEGYWRSAVYALWDSAMAVGLCLGLIVFFRTFLNRQGRLTRAMPPLGYTVYVVHIPIVVFLAVALKEVEMEHLLKFGLAGVIAIPLCFAAAYVVRKIPYASKVL